MDVTWAGCWSCSILFITAGQCHTFYFSDFYIHIFSCVVTQCQQEGAVWVILWMIWAPEEIRHALLEQRHRSTPDNWMHCLQKIAIPEWFYFSYFHLISLGWLSLNAGEKPISHFHAWNSLWQGRQNQQKQLFPCLQSWTAAELNGELSSSFWGRAGEVTCHSRWPPPACSPAPAPTCPALEWPSGSIRLAARRQAWILWELELQSCAEMAQGPELFSLAEEQRNMTALPVTESFKMGEDLGNFPEKVCLPVPYNSLRKSFSWYPDWNAHDAT